MNPVITQEQLRAALDYNSETGHFTWKQKVSRKVVVGARAGTPAGPNGYRAIKLFGEAHLEHRLAWFWVHGTWPAKFIDHKNRDRTDNRISNLREANHLTNACNMGCHKDNRAGVKGVTQRTNGRWQAVITANKKRKALGTFATLAEAHAAYKAAADVLHGEFAPR